MGFYVDVHGRDRSLVDTIRDAPERLFRRPYLGYMFFLATKSDSTVVDWMRDNVVDLHHLTGADLAFAIFFERVEVTIVTDRSRGTRYHEREMPSWSTQMVEGEQSWLQRMSTKSVITTAASASRVRLEDGDKLALAGTNYRLATELGVLDAMPCVVVFDMLPSSDMFVRSLKGDLTDLTAGFRRIIHQFRRTSAYAELASSLSDVLDAEASEANVRRRLEEAKSRLVQLRSRFPSNVELDEHRALVHQWLANPDRRIRKKAFKHAPWVDFPPEMSRIEKLNAFEREIEKRTSSGDAQAYCDRISRHLSDALGDDNRRLVPGTPAHQVQQSLLEAREKEVARLRQTRRPDFARLWLKQQEAEVCSLEDLVRDAKGLRETKTLGLLAKSAPSLVEAFSKDVVGSRGGRNRKVFDKHAETVLKEAVKTGLSEALRLLWKIVLSSAA